jgi:hypothetical protein
MKSIFFLEKTMNQLLERLFAEGKKRSASFTGKAQDTGATPYSPAFYAARRREADRKYSDVFSTVFSYFPHITSAVDVGCGAGTWLYALKNTPYPPPH